MNNQVMDRERSKMRAVICTKYGSPDKLELRTVEKPIPKDNEVLVRIHATTVTSGDAKLRNADFPLLFWLPMRLAMGFRGPRKAILGSEISGEVEDVGHAVKLFQKGDQIFGSAGTGLGAHAEYINLKEDSIVIKKPNNLSFEDLAAVPYGSLTALYFLRKGNIQKNQKILIYGASGSIGTAAVQLAKYFGAEVTGVCSTKNLEFVQSLGADKVVDYTKTNLSDLPDLYDIVFDTVGKTNFSDCKQILKKNGYYLLAITKFSSIMRGMWSHIHVIGGMARDTIEELTFIKELLEKGRLRPVIDSQYPLEQIAEAHNYVDKGHKRGAVIITINDHSHGEH